MKGAGMGGVRRRRRGVERSYAVTEKRWVRMEKREPDVGIAAGALQPCPTERCRRRGMTACRCDAEPTYGSNPHRRGGDRFKKNRNNPPRGGGVLQTAGFRCERWFRISALRLAGSHRVALQLGRPPIRFKKIVTSGPQPAGGLWRGCAAVCS